MNFLIRKIIKYMFLPLGIIYSILDKHKNKIVILMYHRVNDTINKELSVKIDNFVWQMNYLKKSKFNIISIDDALLKIKNKEINGKYVVITFDDGYEDFYLNAYPILVKYNFPATIYLVPGFIEIHKTFWWDKDIGESKLMNWSQINEICENNLITIGSHTMNHINLQDTQDEKKIRYELEMSKLLLQEKTKKRVVHFSYPYGYFAKTAEKLVKKIYKTGVLIFKGKAITDCIAPSDLCRLKRIPVQNSDGRLLFVYRLNGFLILEELIRKIIKK